VEVGGQRKKERRDSRSCETRVLKENEEERKKQNVWSANEIPLNTLITF
jgi:hypothetical protein